MIRITIELVPYGDESQAKVIAMGVIANDGTGTLRRGNYRYQLSQSKRPHVTSRKGGVKDFSRLQKNVWHLLKLVLNTAFGPKEA